MEVISSRVKSMPADSSRSERVSDSSAKIEDYLAKSQGEF